MVQQAMRDLAYNKAQISLHRRKLIKCGRLADMIRSVLNERRHVKITRYSYHRIGGKVAYTVEGLRKFTMLQLSKDGWKVLLDPVKGPVVELTNLAFYFKDAGHKMLRQLKFSSQVKRTLCAKTLADFRFLIALNIPFIRLSCCDSRTNRLRRIKQLKRLRFIPPEEVVENVKDEEV